jgi:hypothetical protein
LQRALGFLGLRPGRGGFFLGCFGTLFGPLRSSGLIARFLAQAAGCRLGLVGAFRIQPGGSFGGFGCESGVDPLGALVRALATGGPRALKH